eukprot:TRINITY_DN24190_c0_g1_i1.p1 TRINITY_DN24190_c0_g1~~TRINITY_DN24190_c0_g1_i1.p1  ORF type:complete len:607 (-),score=51.68 TRINITY_DN24190_c0_g1_i1:57-1793(-)
MATAIRKFSLLGFLLLCMVEPIAPEHHLDGSYACGHGEYDNELGICRCFSGWKVSDLMDFSRMLQGSCSTIACQSDEQCKLELASDNVLATCPVEGWSCNCGWGYIFTNGVFGVPTNQDSKCVGVAGLSIITVSEWMMAFFTHAWRYFCFAAVCLLPFGQTRTRCQHREPSPFRFVSYVCFGRCSGFCALTSSWLNWRDLQYDLAWSIFALDFLVWLYGFAASLWLLAATIWTILISVQVSLAVVATVFATIFVTLTVCFTHTQYDSITMAPCVDCTSHIELGTAASCCCCYPAWLEFRTVGPTRLSTPPMYFDDSVIQWREGGIGTRLATNYISSWCWVCRPIACVLLFKPRMPSNLWGGVVGFLVLGTHRLTPQCWAYQGGSSFVDFLGMRRRSEDQLHGDMRWRAWVHSFLTTSTADGSGIIVAPQEMPPDGGAPPSGFAASMDNATDVVEMSPAVDMTQLATTLSRGIFGTESLYFGVRFIILQRPINGTFDNCVSSTFDDYLLDRCWLCTEVGRPSYDLWMLCGHIFCSACSIEMIKRHLPCPLCRTASVTVKRGWPPAKPSSYAPPLSLGEE